MHSVHYGMCLEYLADTVSASTDNLVCALPTARCIGYRDVIHPWESMRSPTQAHSHGMLCLQHSDIADRTRFRKLLKTHLFDSRP